jgi:NAD+ dependent glucose-6-phosphate dehydrogenase
VITLEVADPDACMAACEGVDTVVHLAAITNSRVGFYEGLLDTNIKGLYNVLHAAKAQGCRRAIVASSVQAIGGYPLDVQVRTGDAPRPMNLYAVTKAFAELMAHYFASEGLSCIAIRVGSFEAEWVRRWPVARVMSTFVSKRDMSELLVRCIEAEDVPFAVVHGVSDNRFKRLDLTDTRETVGYKPLDDGFKELGAELTYWDRWYSSVPGDPEERER